MRFHRTFLASITLLTLAGLALGAAAPVGASVQLPGLPSGETFHGAGVWQSSSGMPTFPGVGTTTGPVAITTDGPDGTLTWGDASGATTTADGVVAWSKSPVVPYDDAAWNVHFEMDLDADTGFPGAWGDHLAADGIWQATPVYSLCTMSYPSTCTVYAVGPLYLSNNGFVMSPGSGVMVAGVYASTYCTSGAQTLNIHTPCDGNDLPCTNNDCHVVIHPPPECLPNETGDRVCVEQEDGGVCVKGYQLTAPTDILLYEQVCYDPTPMGFCFDIVAGLGTLSGFHGVSGWACANAQWPLTCWTLHMGYAGDAKTC